MRVVVMEGAFYTLDHRRLYALREGMLQLRHALVSIYLRIMTDESQPMGGFILAQTLVQNGTSCDNGTTGGTLNQQVLGFLVG